MPFTPTHVLAILPVAAIRRLPLPFSALAIGSMIPDFPLFVPYSPDYLLTHSAPGLVIADLPLGLACFFLWHLVIKLPLFVLLPVAVQSRCAFLVAAMPTPHPGAIAWAGLAIVIGAATHVVWDAFTHGDRWGTHLFPALNEPVLKIGRYVLPGFKVLQYGSSLIGLPCLALLLALWLRRRSPGKVASGLALGGGHKIAIGLAVLAPPVLVAVVFLLRGRLTNTGRLVELVTTSGLALMISTLVYCTTYHAIGARPHRPSGKTESE